MSPAPFWSMTCSTSTAGTLTTPDTVATSAPFGPRVTTASTPSLIERRKGSLQLVVLKEREYLGLIREQHVDVGGHKIKEVSTVPGDTEHVRQRERDHGVVLVGEIDDLANRLLRRRQVKEVALDVGDLRSCDEIPFDVVRVQLIGRAEVGRHRALGVGRDEDVASSRRALAGPSDRELELNAKGREVVAKALAALVVGNLADVAAGSPEIRDARDRVGDRSALTSRWSAPSRDRRCRAGLAR